MQLHYGIFVRKILLFQELPRRHCKASVDVVMQCNNPHNDGSRCSKLNVLHTALVIAKVKKLKGEENLHR
jgi:hypothetical protein